MLDKTAYREPDTLAGKVALVIGGSGGIGAAVAAALADAGAELVIHGRDQAKLARQAEGFAARGRAARVLAADLSSGTAPRELLDAARACDLLVVAFGPFVRKPLSMTTAEDWRLVALACLALPGFVASEAAAAMAERGFGRILLFGGTRTDAIRGFKSNAAYAAAKTGLGVVAKSLAVEFAPRGVSCALLCPGFVDTEYLDAGAREALRSASPRGRLIPSAALAGLALSLLEGGMDLANGSIITADEGLYAL